MNYYVIGLNVHEAQGYAMQFKEEHRGKRVTLLSVEQVKNGALLGLGEGTEVLVSPRAFRHRDAITLGLQLEVLEARGVPVRTLKEN